MSFSSGLLTWHDFFLLTGTASATLVGLLFVSLSLHVEFLTDANSESLRTMARFTFFSFLSIVVLSVIFLIPSLTTQLAGSFLVFLALSHTLHALHSARGAWRDRVWLDMAGPLAFFVGAELLAGLATTWTGYLVLQGTADFSWLMVAIALMLTANARNSWGFLIGLAQLRKRNEALRP